MSVSSSIRQSFLAGLLALLPLYITLKIVSIVFVAVDGPLGGRINQLLQLATHLGDLPLRAGQDRLQLADAVTQLGEPVTERLRLELGEPVEAHLQDGLRLPLAELELGAELLPRALPGARPAGARGRAPAPTPTPASVPTTPIEPATSRRRRPCTGR
mgnify:CR=1 FL=1